MKRLVFLWLLSITGIVSAQKIITKKIGDFTELKVFDKIHLELIKGSENKVEVSGINKKDVDAILKDKVLKIKMSLDNLWDNNNTKVIVYYTDISKIDVNEGAIVKVKETIHTKDLDLRAQEGASITASIKSNYLIVRSVTGGEINLNGVVDEQEIIIKAGGKYLAEELKTKVTQVKISAGGKANINASTYVKANTNAGGVIRIYGKPKEIDSKKVFGGKIIEVK